MACSESPGRALKGARHGLGVCGCHLDHGETVGDALEAITVAPTITFRGKTEHRGWLGHAAECVYGYHGVCTPSHDRRFLSFSDGN